MVSFSGAARPLAVVAGALVALESSQSLDLTKLAFFAVAILALAGSVLHAWTTRDSALVRAARPWLLASAITALIVGLSFPVALANGTAPGAWIRDAASYVLVAAAPWLALDLGAAVSPRVATWAAAIAGSLAAASFTINWLQRRAIADLPIDRLVLPSFALATAFFALALSRSIWGGRDRFAWAAAASAVIGLLLATGTRTTLALAAIPIVLLVDAVRIGGRARLRTSFAPVIAPLVVMALFVGPGMLRSVTAPSTGIGEVASPAPATPLATVTPVAPPTATSVPVSPSTAAPGSGPPPVASPPASPRVTPLATPVPTPLATPSPTPDTGGRFGTISDVISGTDSSLSLRWIQTKAAWTIFVSAPLVGRGLGVPIPWTDVNGTPVAEFWADTPLTVLAKFGLLGIVMWVALGWATLSTMRRLRNHDRPRSVARSALLGLATGLVVLSPFGPQLEDKGTGLAMILILGLAFAVIRTSRPVEDGLPAGE